jgi:hypothetical protein
MTPKEIFFPELPSDEFNTINNLARQAVRLVQQKTPSIRQEELIVQPMVQALLRFIEQRTVTAFEHPKRYCHDKIWAEYQAKLKWSIDEAVSLAAGIDPFYFSLDPSRCPSQWREQREAILVQVKHAIKHGELSTATGKDKLEYVTPYGFCYFALEAELIHERATSFFKDMRSTNATHRWW